MDFKLLFSEIIKYPPPKFVIGVDYGLGDKSVLTIYKLIKKSMTNYEKIVKILSYGFQVKCQDTDGDWTIYSSMMSDGMIRSSNYNETIEECFDELGDCIGTEADINSLTFTTIEPIIKVPKLFKVGDLVDVAEEWKNSNNLKNLDMKGLEIKEIKEVGCYYLWDRSKLGACVAPLWAVTPHISNHKLTELKTQITEMKAKLAEMEKTAEGMEK